MEQSINYGLHKIGLPTIIVEYKGNKLLMMLDTGSNDNFLAPVVYKYFRDELKLIDSDGVLLGANGVSNDIISVEMPIKINETEFTKKFIVLPNSESFDKMEAEAQVQIHGVIGTKFMCEQGWVIDFVNQKVYTKQNVNEEEMI